MMSFEPSDKAVEGRSLGIEEIRLVSDLRIMHAKVDELYHLVEALRRQHHEPAIVKYADHDRLGEDIRKVDEIYLWYVKLKEEHDRAGLGG